MRASSMLGRLAPVLVAGMAMLTLGAAVAHAQAQPDPLRHWNAFENFVDLYRQAYQPQSGAHPTGNQAAPQTANTSGPPGTPLPGSTADQGSSQQPQGFSPFGGGMSFGFGGGGGFGRGNDHGNDRGRDGDRERRQEDDRRQLAWEHQVDAAFPPTPRDPNYANAPPSQLTSQPPGPPPSGPPSPPSGPSSASDVSQGTMITRGNGDDNGGAGLMGFLTAFVTGTFDVVASGIGGGGPPPPMVLSDEVFETSIQGVADVVPVSGDLGGDVADDIIM